MRRRPIPALHYSSNLSNADKPIRNTLNCISGYNHIFTGLKRDTELHKVTGTFLDASFETDKLLNVT
jgi:hypothetical protein